MDIAIVTGASSGLGNEFVKQIDKKETLDEIWIIARREDKLEILSNEIRAKTKILPLDLTSENDMNKFKTELEKESPNIRILVNSAGIGKMGDYSQIDMKDTAAMIDLDCRAAVQVTVLCIPYMKKDSRILEICSTAGFQPLPYLNVYAASKAFMISYSRGLRWELSGKGINVTAVCPYWIRDTEFIGTAKETSNDHAVRHFPLASKSRTVVNRALRDSSLNLAVSTPSPVALIQRFFTKFLPHSLIIWIWQGLRRI